MKMSKPINKILFIIIALLIYSYPNFLQGQGADKEPKRETIKMLLKVTNPTDEKKTIFVHEYLPPEITKEEYIIDRGDLELKYDTKTSRYYVESKGEIELPPKLPGELAYIREFIVELKDVWFIPEERLDNLKIRTEIASNGLKGSKYYDIGKKIADNIYQQLNNIATSQNNEAIDREDRMVIYRENLQGIEQIKEDIETIENYVTSMDKSAVLGGSEDTIDAPSKTATWMIIFVVLTFLGIFGGVFFFVWIRHARSLEKPSSEAQKSAFPESSSSNKNDDSGEDRF
jgi:hypothetical protein